MQMLPRRAETFGRTVLFAALGAILILQAFLYSRSAPTGYDALRVIEIAASLHDHGVYADPQPFSEKLPPPGRYVAPAYPALIAALARVDNRMADTLRCLAAHGTGCASARPLRSLIALQVAACLLALALAYATARAMSGSEEVAALTTVVMFLMSDLARFASGVTPVPIILLASMLFIALLVAAHMRRSVSAAAAAGVTVGALALLDVYYIGVALLAPALFVLAERLRAQGSARFALTAAIAIAFGGAFLIVPWLARNLVQFNDAAPTQGMEAILLAQRLAYNAVPPGEWLVGIVRWLPGVGESLSTFFADPRTSAKFALYFPGSLLNEGERLLAQAQASSPRSPFGQLVATHVTGDAARYLLSTPPLVLRGLGATGGLLTLIALIALPAAVKRLAAQHKLGPFALAGGSILCLTVVQALLTPNLPWMNVALTFIYAYAIAEVAGGVEMPIAVRRLFDPAGQSRA
jgi:hypothetical protein